MTAALSAEQRVVVMQIDHRHLERGLHLGRWRQRPFSEQSLEHGLDFGLHRRRGEVQHTQVLDVG